MQSRRIRKGTEVKRILNTIRLIVRALRLFDRETQSRYGLSAAQMFVLHALEDDGGISMNQLAELTATDQSSASVVVKRLVAAGHVARSTNDHDHRRVELRLTAAGRRIVRRAPHPTQEKLLKSLARMSGAQRKQLALLLEKMVGGMGVSATPVPMLFDEKV